LQLAVVTVKSSLETGRAQHADLDRDGWKSQQIFGARPHLVDQAGAAFGARDQFGGNTHFFHRPGGVAAHHAEAVRPYPFKGFLDPGDRHAQPVKAQLAAGIAQFGVVFAQVLELVQAGVFVEAVGIRHQRPEGFRRGGKLHIPAVVEFAVQHME
jgi:hypothetical protein